MYSSSLPRTPAPARFCLRRLARDESGYTFLELLVVCLIIGVLAAIAIPAFASQQGKATDVQAKAVARAAETAAEALAAEGSGSYNRVTPAELNSYEPAVRIAAGSSNAYLSAASGTKSEYSVTAKARGGDEFTIARNAQGEVSRTCASPVKGTGCGGAAAGSW